MKLSAKPESVMERIALLLNLAPLPLVDTQIAFYKARAIMAAALAPSGLYSVGEFLRSDSPGVGGAVTATMDLYFALTSASGTWSLKEITSWQREAGLRPLKPIQFPSLPGWAVAPATKPG